MAVRQMSSEYDTCKPCLEHSPTGAQQGSVAIIRLSGPEAVRIASAVFKPSQRKSSWAPKSHRIYHGHVLDTDGSIVDEVLSSATPCSDATFDATFDAFCAR